jgi:hypothetical protein
MEPDEQAQTLAVIDVEVKPIDNPEPEDEETWYSAVQIQGLLKLSKAGLQQSISKLQSIYGLDIATLRRGAARATQYSELALKACKLLNAGKLSELRKLVEATPAASSPAQSGALTIAEYTPALDRRIAELNQNATSTSASLNQNVMQLLAQIATENQAANSAMLTWIMPKSTQLKTVGLHELSQCFKLNRRHKLKFGQLRAMNWGRNNELLQSKSAAGVQHNSNF